MLTFSYNMIQKVSAVPETICPAWTGGNKDKPISTLHTSSSEPLLILLTLSQFNYFIDFRIWHVGLFSKSGKAVTLWHLQGVFFADSGAVLRVCDVAACDYLVIPFLVYYAVLVNSPVWFLPQIMITTSSSGTSLSVVSLPVLQLDIKAAWLTHSCVWNTRDVVLFPPPLPLHRHTQDCSLQCTPQSVVASFQFTVTCSENCPVES